MGYERNLVGTVPPAAVYLMEGEIGVISIEKLYYALNIHLQIQFVMITGKPATLLLNQKTKFRRM